MGYLLGVTLVVVLLGICSGEKLVEVSFIDFSPISVSNLEINAVSPLISECHGKVNPLEI